MRKSVHLVLITLGLAGVAGTFIPFAGTNAWWVRILDYPRWEIMVGMLLVLAVYLAVFRSAGWIVWVFAAVLWVGIGYQAALLAAWTPLPPARVLQVGNCDGARFRLFSANVLFRNHYADALIRRVGATNPDLVLLMETDEWWEQHLTPLYQSYPFVVKHVGVKGYGIHLFSRIPLKNARVEFLVAADMPSIFTGVQLPNGVVRFVAIHPDGRKPIRKH